jgi:hypothetical protein
MASKDIPDPERDFTHRLLLNPLILRGTITSCEHLLNSSLASSQKRIVMARLQSYSQILNDDSLNRLCVIPSEEEVHLRDVIRSLTTFVLSHGKPSKGLSAVISANGSTQSVEPLHGLLFTLLDLEVFLRLEKWVMRQRENTGLILTLGSTPL